MAEKYLKKWNLPYVILFVLLNVALFLALRNYGPDFWEDLHQRVLDLKSKDSLFQIALPLIIGVAGGILRSSWKEVLVFWRLENPLPGCRVFTELAKSDPRIDMNELEAELAPLPEEPKAQNSKWFKLYKQMEEEITVKESHKQYLLYRELTGISGLFLLFGPIALIFIGVPVWNVGVYAAITLSEFVVCSIIAQNHGKRFVCNVLVEFLNRKRPKSESKPKERKKAVKNLES
jgi:hypothetical protein